MLIVSPVEGYVAQQGIKGDCRGCYCFSGRPSGAKSELCKAFRDATRCESIGVVFVKVNK